MADVSYGYDRTRPRTRVTLDDSNLSSSNVASEKPLVLLGSANGGKPQEPIELTNFPQAKEIFRGGELLDAIEMAWQPSPNQSGAGRIYAIRTDEAEPAKYEEDGLKVTSKLYGHDANDIQIELTENEKLKSKRFSVYFTKERYERTYDNIGNIFNIQYDGEEAQATVEIDVDEKTGEATHLRLYVGESSEDLEEVRKYSLGEGVYSRINILVNDINNLSDFKAEMDSYGGNKNIETKYLDKLEETDIKGDEVTVTAVAGDLKNQLRNDQFVEVEIDLSDGVPDEIELVSLDGGDTSAPPSSWADVFAKTADLGAYYIVPITQEEAIHGELAQFLREESEAGNHLRGFVGGGSEETLGEIQDRQTSLRNARVSIVGNSGTRKMADGRSYNFPAYMAAAMVAGMASGLEIGEPITYKHLDVKDLDRKFTGDQLDQLDAAGVIMLEFVRTRSASYFRVTSDPTTYNSDVEPVKNRTSLGEISDFLTTELRTMLDENYIGTRTHRTSASIIKNSVESFLDDQKDVGGLIVDYEADDVQVVLTGNEAKINLAVQPAQGLDFINVSITYDEAELEA